MSQSAALNKPQSQAWKFVPQSALCLGLCLLPLGLVGGQSSSTNPQDVPQQQAPGTNNPDIGKQRRPAPASPGQGSSDTNSADVPHQQPGTNDPDVAKQRQDSDSNSSSDKKGTASQKKAKRKSTAGSTRSTNS